MSGYLRLLYVVVLTDFLVEAFLAVFLDTQLNVMVETFLTVRYSRYATRCCGGSASSRFCRYATKRCGVEVSSRFSRHAINVYYELGPPSIPISTCLHDYAVAFFGGDAIPFSA